MAQMVLTVTPAGEGNVVECKTPQGVTMTIDGDGGAKGATPMQHLLASLGACALMDVKHILVKKRLAFANLRVECVATRPDEGQVRPFLDFLLQFRVDGDVPTKAFEDAVRLSVEKYCSVGATLEKGTPVKFDARVG